MIISRRLMAFSGGFFEWMENYYVEREEFEQLHEADGMISACTGNSV